MKYVITVNPHGGKKLGPRLLNRVKPLFEAENVELFIIETTYAGHAQDLAHHLDLSQFDGFLAIGGDGTLLYIFSQLNKPLFGINCGGVGFLAEMEQDGDFFEAIKRIESGSYESQK